MVDNESRSLESGILDWFQKQGYSLEMRVARVFRDAGFSVSQFESYVDPESGTAREIDVVASVSREVAGILASAALLMECKHCPRPWVMLTSPKRTGPFYCFSRILQGNFEVREWREYRTLQGRLLARMLVSLGRAETSGLDFFCMPERPAYRIVEAHKDRQREKDNAYGAVMQAQTSATAHDRRTEMIFEETVRAYTQWVYEDVGGTTDFRLFSSVAFPVVVAEGRMFECCLDANGDVELSETNTGTVLVPSKERLDRGNTVSYDSAIRVVTESAVESFAAQSKKALDALLSQEDAVTEVWDYERSRATRGRAPSEIPF